MAEVTSKVSREEVCREMSHAFKEMLYKYNYVTGTRFNFETYRKMGYAEMIQSMEGNFYAYSRRSLEFWGFTLDQPTT